ncbi:hypothetical protein [Holospora curviuscula]|uniref:hypothetical protein n=1 Tax=Holospora curviuscula TaxID=1082868 RepID=UPI001A9C3657|nr:hypothetical protein [Holospora curviuscula]
MRSTDFTITDNGRRFLLRTFLVLHPPKNMLSPHMKTLHRSIMPTREDVVYLIPAE